MASKRITSLLILINLLILNNLMAQRADQKCSANARFILQEMEKNQLVNSQRVCLSTINSEQYVSGMVKLNASGSEMALKSLGVLIGTRAGTILTVKIPLYKLKEVLLLSALEYLQLDEPIHPMLDVAKRTTKVDSVHKGVGLPMPFSGKNVVLGIIDVGFDYTHPAFYDTLGNKYRVKRVWEQKTNGTPPSGYSYGAEYSDSLSIVTRGTDNSHQTHGTHVAGIAGGSGNGSQTIGKYRGVGFETEVVMVGITPVASQWTGSGLSDIIDGVNYIYQYAASVGKPAVVNLSWGCTIGPHDGSSLFSQALNNLTGAGRIFVVSAGNNGGNKVHLKKNFTPADTTVSTFITFSTYLPEKKTWVDVWGTQGNTFAVKLSLYNGSTKLSSIGSFTLNNLMADTFLVGSSNDTCYVKLAGTSVDYNGKPHVLLDIYSKAASNLCLTVTANAGTVHVWEGYVSESSGYYGALTNGGQAWATAGDVEYTIGEMGCAASAITVGAYASKVSWTDLNGGSWSYNSYVNANKLVPFSSHGPTADGLIKPDITAPGLTLASAISSYDTSYTLTGSNSSSLVRSYTSPLNAKTYYYGEMSGTSMSAPMVSGIVSLLLQANPNLTPQEIKTIFNETAIKDSYTTQNPNGSLWGGGKVNAYRSLLKVLSLTGMFSSAPEATGLLLFPNPAEHQLSIYSGKTESKLVKLEIHTITGALVISEEVPVNQGLNVLELDKYELNPGIYLTTLAAKEGIQTVKVILH